MIATITKANEYVKAMKEEMDDLLQDQPKTSVGEEMCGIKIYEIFEEPVDDLKSNYVAFFIYNYIN